MKTEMQTSIEADLRVAVPTKDLQAALPVTATKVVTSHREVQIDISGRSHERYAEACAVVRKHKRGSISLVQRHLRIGYNTAAMLLEAMVGDVLAEMPPTTKLCR
jgi:DNA segregation ATPase FtsK/SpoIIIE-like protein